MSPDGAEPGPGRAWWAAVAAVVVVAVVSRLLWPDLRPAHHDEAVNWYLSGRVARTGVYSYNPGNYHGPTFYYLSASLRGLAPIVGRLTSLRLPTMAVGIAWVLLPLLAIGPRADHRQRSRALWTAVCLTASPAALFYARQAIHETTLAFCTALALVAGARFFAAPPVTARRWAVLAGVGVGGMVATKETAAITLGAWVVGAGLARARCGPIAWGGPARARLGAIVAGVLAAFCVAGLFFTALGRDLSALGHAVESLSRWSTRGMQGGGHEKPVWTFAWWLARGEGPVVLVALGGGVAAWRARDPVGIALLGWFVSATVVYSAIAYKTPWCMLQLTLPAGLLAGRALASLALPGPTRLGVWGRRVALAAVAASALLAVRVAFVTYDDPHEPLVYVQTHRESLEALDLLQRLRAPSDGSPPPRWRFFGPGRYPWNFYLREGRLRAEAHWPADVDADILWSPAARYGAMSERIGRTYLRKRFRFRDWERLDFWVAEPLAGGIADPEAWQLESPRGR